MLRVLHTLTPDNAEEYDVSIRLSPEELCFTGYSRMDRTLFFSESYVYNAGDTLAEAVKTVFFSQPQLSYVFGSLSVVFTNCRYILVPDCIYEERHKEALLSYCQAVNVSDRTLEQRLPRLGAVLLYAADKKTVEFLTRSLANPVFGHYLTPLLNIWMEQSIHLFPKQLYIIMQKNSFDMICFERGELLFLNAFDCETANDALYYIMYVCKQIRFNQLDDRLYLYGDKRMCSSVNAVASTYIRNIELARSLTGGVVEATGVDKIALIGCGL